jgi:hypothetical protein
VLGLKKVGVVAAEIIGLIDRDFYSDAVLDAAPNGVAILPLHEIESVICDQNVVAALAEQFGKKPEDVWDAFLDRVRKAFRGQALSAIVARRVRSRVGDLLDGAFCGAQIKVDLTQTVDNHGKKLAELDLLTRTTTMFDEESKRVADALAGGGREVLALLPGKHLLGLLTNLLGLRNTKELTSMVVRSLNRKQLKKDAPLLALGAKVEKALLAYLPSRRA